MSPLHVNLITVSFLNQTFTGLILLLAPSIGKTLFPKTDQITQLLWIYSIFGTSILTRPLGVIFFGKIVERWGAHIAFRLSLMGTAMASLCMAMLSFFHGTTAVIVFCVCRMLHNISMHGECIMARLVLVESQSTATGYRLSAWFEGATMVGLSIASFMSCLALDHILELSWQKLFLILSFISFCAGLHRWHIFSSLLHGFFSKSSTLTKISPLSSFPQRLANLKRHLAHHLPETVQIFLITGVSQLTYIFPFVLFNTALPFVTHMSESSLLSSNIYFVGFDIFLIFILPRFIEKYRAESIFMTSAIGLACVFLSFGWVIGYHATLLEIIFLRILIVFFGVIFLIPQIYYFKYLTQQEEGTFSQDILWVGLSKAASSAIFGRLMPMLCILSIQYTKSIAFMGYIAAGICVFTAMMVRIKNK